MSAQRVALARRAAIGLCAALLLGFSAAYAGLVTRGDAGPKQSDFLPYYAAARLVATGHGPQVYDTRAIGSLERHLVRPLRVSDGVMPFLYPAYFAVALAPLSLLPYDAAFFVWLGLNLLLLVLILFAAARLLELRGSGRVLLWLGGLSFFPVLLALAQGQVSIVLLGLFFGAYSAACGERAGLCGGLLALALIKPPYVLPVVLVLATHRRWRTIAVLAVAGLVLLLAPVAVIGPSAVTGFGDTIVKAAGWTHQIGGFQPQFNQSFSGFTHLLLSSSPAEVLTLALDVSALALLFGVTVVTDELPSTFGLAVIVGILIGPHVLLHDLSLLLIPAVAALASRRPEASLALILAGGYVLIIAGLPAAGALHVQLSVVAMVALGLWMASSRVQQLSQLVLRREIPRSLPAAPNPLLPRSVNADR